MNSTFRTLASIALLAAATLAHSIPSTPPSAPELMPAPIDTTDWIFVSDAIGFENGKIKFCEKYDRSLGFINDKCATIGYASPQEALLKVAPEGAILTGFAPHISNYGRMRGMYLYYKRSATSPAPRGETSRSESTTTR